MFDFAADPAKAMSSVSNTVERGAIAQGGPVGVSGRSKPRRMRKAWEFTWDDGKPIVTDTPPASSAALSPVSTAPRRMRKAWEFTWDDGKPIITETPTACSARVSSVPAPVSAKNVPAKDVPAENVMSGSVAEEPSGVGVRRIEPVGPEMDAVTSAVSPVRRRRRVRATEVEGSPAGSSAADSPAVSLGVAETPAMPAPGERPKRRRRVGSRQAPVEPQAEASVALDADIPRMFGGAPEGGAANAAAVDLAPTNAPTPDVDDVDLESVRRRLEALGGKPSSDARHREETPSEEAAWVKGRGGLREVKVVRLNRTKGFAAREQAPSEGAAAEMNDGSLSSDPLVAKALRIAALLREKFPENAELTELRRAIREMRKAFADVEARAYLTQQRGGPPAFFQAYDPKTGTG